jgi:hypothetical protein
MRGSGRSEGGRSEGGWMGGRGSDGEVRRVRVSGRGRSLYTT